MSEVIGKATLEVGADSSSLESGLSKAGQSVQQFEKTAAASAEKTKGSFKTFGESAGDAAQKMDASARRFMSSLERQADRAGKTASEYAAFRAQQLGVGDAAAPMIAKLRLAEQQFEKTGVSAKQTAAAMRSVPAQMTDIVTSLAGGQNPLLVLTQQGGQLKDMFGGIGPAARALGSYVAGLVNPFSIAAAAAAALGVAMYKGSQESTAFNNALIMTGNYAGKSADQIQSMAAHISSSIGTQGAASEALTQVAATGKIAGDQIEAIGLAAVAMNKATGAAVDETVKMFVSLGDEPAKASAKLNEQYHYLTASVYDQIRALEEQGRKDEAASLAQKTLADALTTRANQVRENLGYMERAWNSVAGAAKSAWDAMVGLGRAATLDEIRSKITETQNKIAEIENGNGFANGQAGAAFGAGSRGRAAQLKVLRDELAQLQGQAKPLEDASVKAAADAEKAKLDAEKIAARDRLDAQAKATRSRAEQRKDEIDQLKRDAEKVGMATEEYNRRVAAIEEKYKDPKGPKAPKEKAYQDDAATRFIQQLRDQDAATRAALESNVKLTAAEKAQAEFLQKIADLKEKSILTAEQKSFLAAEDRIKAQLDLNVQHERELKLKEDRNKLDERGAQLQSQMASYQQTQREQYGRQLDATGMGAEALRNSEAVRSIYREYQRRQGDLDSATPKSLIGSDEYKAQADLIRAGLDQSLKDYADYYAQLREKQADWKNGATEAIANYVESTRNLMSQASDAMSGTFKGMEDALTAFVTTGKLNFKSLADSIIADLVRIQMKQAVAGLIGMIGNMFAPAVAGPSTQGSAWNGFSTGPGVDVSYGGLAGARADGGPVNAGSAYLVGERGPEIFKPNASGTIVPNHALGGGNVSITVENNAGAQVTPQVSEGPNGERFVRFIIDQAKREIAGDVASGQGLVSKGLGARYGLTPKFR